MTHPVMFTDAETALLVDLLEHERGEATAMIRRATGLEAKEELRARERMIQRLIEKLQAPAGKPELAKRAG